MTTPTGSVFLGVDWTTPDRAWLRIATPSATPETLLLPYDATLRYQVISPTRLCCGYFDVSTTPPTHVACTLWSPVTTGTQCPRCRSFEGFTMAHIAHHDPTAAPAHIRAYLGQPHWLYVDIFADGTTKVGTVAQARLDSRLAEQGAFAAFYVARTADGYGIRRVEDAVSSAFGLRQAVPAKWKLRALEAAIDAPAHHAALARQLDLIRQYLTTLVGIDGLTVLDTAQPWQVPPCATAAFAAAPVMIYPADLTKGLHGLLLQAMTGSIGVFTTTDDPDAPRYATNLADLKGVQIELGNYQSPAYDEQPVLF